MTTKNTNTSVSLFVHSLHGGGAERVMLNLAQGFAEKGLKVDLVLTKAVGAYLTKIPPGVRVVDLGAKKLVFMSKLLALRRYLRQEQPKVLISAVDHINAAGWVQRLTGVPTKVIVSVHNTLSVKLGNQPGVLGKLKLQLLQLCYRQADGIVAVSRGVAEDLARVTKLPLRDIRVIYNPVVMPNLLEKAQEPVDHPWFAPGEPPVILGVGRLATPKDFPTLIRAFNILRQHHNVRLMIVGEGENRSELEALVRELNLESEVALPGFTDNPYAYMAKAAVFVLSSAWEGLPTVLIEAIAVGTPVVSTNCPSGPMEILEDGKYGRLVPVGDVEALANAIQATLSNPIAPEILQQRARAFSAERAIEQYLEVLQVALKM
ncbi:MAG: glycosyltransferase [Kastovskya adunca ATA6-11-RM4]|jgi:glycosyltransferase involved in cell wall biosynthesis|nr:glycosyltransferase [Kastovskya adunca ATA6-11-RM4]